MGVRSNAGATGGNTGMPTDIAAAVTEALGYTPARQAVSYLVHKVGNSFYAEAWRNDIQSFTGTDAYMVIQDALNILQPAGAVGSNGGHVSLGVGSFTLSDELKITGWEGGVPPYSQLTLTGQGRGVTKIVQNTAGKNGVVIKNQASVYIADLTIDCGSAARSAILCDDSGTTEVSTFKSYFGNLILIATSSSYPALHMKNFFDVETGLLHIQNTNYHAIILENNSTTILYGNSSFGFIRATAGSSHAGLLIRSTNGGTTGKWINLCTFANFECIAGMYGVWTDYAAHCTFNLIDVEYIPKPISLGTYGAGAANDTRDFKFLSGYLFAQGTGATNITCSTYTGGNTFNVFLDGSGVPIADTQAFRQGNSYDVVLGANQSAASISIGNPWNTILQYRTSLGETKFAHSRLWAAATSSTSYTIGKADNNSRKEFTSASAITVTVPLNSGTYLSLPFETEIFAGGTGQITIAPAAGVTLKSRNGLKSNGQYSKIRLIKQGTDIWYVDGDTTV